MATPTLTTIRPGVTFTPAAAAAFQRAEEAWGRRIDVNSTYRDWDKQFRMWRDWNAYVAGRGPYPGHSRAIHPDLSMHCKGLALDSDDWTRPGFNKLMAEHGWIRTAAGDPTERHHFEYQAWRDTRPAVDDIETITDEDEEQDMLRFKTKKAHYVASVNDVETITKEEATALTHATPGGAKFAKISSAEAALVIEGIHRREARRLRRIAEAAGTDPQPIIDALKAETDRMCAAESTPA